MAVVQCTLILNTVFENISLQRLIKLNFNLPFCKPSVKGDTEPESPPPRTSKTAKKNPVKQSSIFKCSNKPIGVVFSPKRSKKKTLINRRKPLTSHSIVPKLFSGRKSESLLLLIMKRNSITISKPGECTCI